MGCAELLELDASPWTTKVTVQISNSCKVQWPRPDRDPNLLQARLALRHRGVQYRTTQYLPGLGEWWVRLRLRKWWGRISAPILFLPTGGTYLTVRGRFY